MLMDNAAIEALQNNDTELVRCSCGELFLCAYGNAGWDVDEEGDVFIQKRLITPCPSCGRQLPDAFRY